MFLQLHTAVKAHTIHVSELGDATITLHFDLV